MMFKNSYFLCKLNLSHLHYATKLLMYLHMRCLVWFYGISTIVGYLIPNLVFKHILDIYDL